MRAAGGPLGRVQEQLETGFASADSTVVSIGLPTTQSTKQRQLIEKSSPRTKGQAPWWKCWKGPRGLLHDFLPIQDAATGLLIPSSSPDIPTPLSGGTFQKSSSEGTGVASHPHVPCTDPPACTHLLLV